MDQPNSPVNTINVDMQDEFAGVLDQIENDSNIRAAVLISKKPSCFVAGADIQMINKVDFLSFMTSFQLRNRSLLLKKVPPCLAVVRRCSSELRTPRSPSWLPSTVQPWEVILTFFDVIIT